MRLILTYEQAIVLGFGIWLAWRLAKWAIPILYSWAWYRVWVWRVQPKRTKKRGGKKC